MQVLINVPDTLPKPLIQKRIRQLEKSFKNEAKKIANQDIFRVNVTVCDGIWTAECDELGLVTEADSYQELTEKAWEIAPELAELNAVNLIGNMRLQFTHEKSVGRAA